MTELFEELKNISVEDCEKKTRIIESLTAERDALAARLAEADRQRDEARAAALREAAALGRAMTKAGCTPGKIWRKLDAMSEHAQPQPADQKRDEDTGPE